MDERAHVEFCLQLLNEPCKTPRMVVNSGSTFLKRCQQAKEMHGHDTPPEVDPERIPKEDATVVRHGLSTGPRGCSLGSAGHGHSVRAGTGPNFSTGTNGQRKGRRSPYETNPEGLEGIRN